MEIPDRFIPHTSSFVCDDIAREVLAKSYGDQHAEEATEHLIAGVIRPISDKICNSGKSQKGKIRLLANALGRKLEKENNVIGVTVTHLIPSRLSSAEESHVSFVLAIKDEDEPDWLSFIASEVLMTRTSLHLTTSTMDFRIHRHALSRFMQRERKTAEHIMENMIQAMHMASMVGSVVASATDSPNCAIPIGDGLLLGKIFVQDNNKFPGRVFHIKYNRRSPPSIWDEARREHLLRGFTAYTDIMTYVGDRQLTPARENLRDLLRNFREEHKETLSHVFNARYFSNATILASDINSAKMALRNARDNLKSLIRGKVWQRFARSVGTGTNG